MEKIKSFNTDYEKFRKELRPLLVLFNNIDFFIIKYCFDSSRNINELSDEIGVSRISIRRHIKKLRKFGFIKQEKKGNERLNILTNYGRDWFLIFVDVVILMVDYLKKIKKKN